MSSAISGEFSRRFSTRVFAMGACYGAYRFGKFRYEQRASKVQWLDDEEGKGGERDSMHAADGSTGNDSNRCALAKRNTTLQELSENETELYDVVIVGGGGLGLYSALDASSRGLKVLLLEGNDFGSGWSSRTSRLVHGPGRMVQRGMRTRSVNQAIEAVKLATETRHLLNVAPGLVAPVATYVPISHVTDGIEHLFLALAANLINMCAGVPNYRAMLSGATTTSPSSSSAPGQQVVATGEEEERKRAPLWLTAEALRECFPGNQRFLGAVRFSEYLIDDVGMCLRLAQRAEQQGAKLLTHTPVVAVATNTTSNRGLVDGVTFEDRFTQKRYRVGAKVVINASGCWLDRVKALSPVDTAIVDEYRTVTSIISSTEDLLLHTPGDGTAAAAASSAPSDVLTPPAPAAGANKAALEGINWLVPGNAKDGRSLTITPWRNGTHMIGSCDSTAREPDDVGEAMRPPPNAEKDISFICAAATSLGFGDLKKHVVGCTTTWFPWLQKEEVFPDAFRAMRCDRAVEDRGTAMIHAVGGNWLLTRQFAQELVDTACERVLNHDALANSPEVDFGSNFESPQQDTKSSGAGGNSAVLEPKTRLKPVEPGVFLSSFAPYETPKEVTGRFPCRTDSIGISKGRTAPVDSNFGAMVDKNALLRYVQEDYALTLADVFVRRTALAVTHPHACLANRSALLKDASSVLGAELQWSKSRVKKEIEECEAFAKRMSDLACATAEVSLPTTGWKKSPTQ